MIRTVGCLGAVVVCVLAVGASADELTLHDGRVFEGLVKAEGGDTLIFEVHRHGMVAEMPFRRTEVKSLVRKELAAPTPPPPPAPAPVVKPPPPATQPEISGPAYFLLPIKGVIGKEVVAAKMEEALTKGLVRADTVLVMEFDSPGGLVSECEAIVELLAKHRDRRSIALVKSAYSAAAIIALTCDEIYMQTTASIGAATAIRDTPWGYSVLDEKFQSVWRSVCRTSADLGGHNTLLAEAMVDPGMQLRIVQKDGKGDVEQVLRVTEEDLRQGRILIERGKLLTMTARQAVECGLAVAIADDLDKVAVAAGLEGWTPVSKVGQEIMTAYAAEVDKAEKAIEQHRVNSEKAYNLARMNKPEYGHYETDHLGRFTPRSRQQWLVNSANCYKILTACEGELDKIIAIAEKMPCFEGEAEWARERKNQVSVIRQSVRDNANRGGL